MVYGNFGHIRGSKASYRECGLENVMEKIIALFHPVPPTYYRISRSVLIGVYIVNFQANFLSLRRGKVCVMYSKGALF